MRDEDMFEGQGGVGLWEGGCCHFHGALTLWM